MSAQNLETLAKRYVELKSRIADLQEEADGLKAELMENREPGEYAAGPLTVKIRKGKRNLDAGAFERRFPVQQYADCYQIKPKALSTIIKQVGENALQDCVKVGAASLVVDHQTTLQPRIEQRAGRLRQVLKRERVSPRRGRPRRFCRHPVPLPIRREMRGMKMASELDLEAVMAANQTIPETTPAPTVESTEWTEIRGIIEDHITNQPRSLQKEIGPSELGTDCLHCLAARLAGWEKRQSAAWLPFIGTCVHERFEHLFNSRKDEFTVPDDDGGEPCAVKRFEAERHVDVGEIHGLHGHQRIHGSIDLYDAENNTTIDWKITGPTTIRNVKANGPSQQYRIQASLYGIGLENDGEPCKRNAIYFLPKNSVSLADALPIEFDFDPKPGRWALSRAQLIANLLDLIEQEDGTEMRDAWIHALPTSPTHCFQCGTWPDDQLGQLSELNENQYPALPDKWRQAIGLLESTYRKTER